MKSQVALVVFLVTLSLVVTSFASDQPFMQAARTDLQKARAALQRAEHNKGGHRANAIGFINSAIDEINRGISFDRTHIRRRRRHHAVPTAKENFSLKGAMVVDQPNMRAALDHLQNARRNLQSARADKGGHRQNAIDLVNRAIGEVNRGIAARN